MSEIRVSIAGICRIIDPGSGGYALLVNHNSLSRPRGRVVYTPVGGALHATTDGLATLGRLGAHSFESSPDLRFRIDTSCLGELAKWLLAGQDHERSAERELFEELVTESRILRLSDIVAMRRPSFAGYNTASAISHRASGAHTRLISLVWDIVLRNEGMKKLIDASQADEPSVAFFTEREIRSGRGPWGEIIGNPISSLLLRPQPRLLIG